MYAAIFDMDGTLVDNNPYHFKAWAEIFEKYKHTQITHEFFNEKLSGVPGLPIMREYFGDMDEEQMQAVFNEKSQRYRDAYAPYAKPINGLERFLTELKDAGVKLAVASSAAVININYIMDHVPIRSYFDAIVDGPHVSKPKPHPQIFLKAAEYLGMKPENCVVFEDSLSGVKAANAAGMKVVGITTTHTASELHPVNLIIDDYTGLTAQKLAGLFDTK
jgi:beta-phosphoglucomutase